MTEKSRAESVEELADVESAILCGACGSVIWNPNVNQKYCDVVCRVSGSRSGTISRRLKHFEREGTTGETLKEGRSRKYFTCWECSCGDGGRCKNGHSATQSINRHTRRCGGETRRWKEKRRDSG